jgi:hypothetical protein
VSAAALKVVVLGEAEESGVVEIMEVASGVVRSIVLMPGDVGVCVTDN